MPKNFQQWDDFDPYLALQDQQALLQYRNNRMVMDHGQFSADSLLRRQQQLPKYKDFITVENPPAKVKKNHVLKVSLICRVIVINHTIVIYRQSVHHRSKLSVRGQVGQNGFLECSEITITHELIDNCICIRLRGLVCCTLKGERMNTATFSRSLLPHQLVLTPYRDARDSISYSFWFWFWLIKLG